MSVGFPPLTPEVDEFHCNNKLISGEPFPRTRLGRPAGAAVHSVRLLPEHDGGTVGAGCDDRRQSGEGLPSTRRTSFSLRMHRRRVREADDRALGGGFSYFVVGANAADALAPVVAELTGH